MSYNIALIGPLLIAALVALYAEWRAEAGLARRHLWTALSLGALAGSARLYLARAGAVIPLSGATPLPEARWGWQLLGDTLGYAAWAALGLALSARSGLPGALLSRGGSLAEWWRTLRYGVGLGAILAAASWLACRLGVESPLSVEAALSPRDALILGAYQALHSEIIARLGLLSILIWLPSSLPARHLPESSELSGRCHWPLVLGIALATLLWGIVSPGEGPWLAALSGVLLGYAFVQAGWEAAFLAHFISFALIGGVLHRPLIC